APKTSLAPIAPLMRDTMPPAAAVVVHPEPSCSAPTGGRIGNVLREVVAEKTGYPVEMLELNMELDADLGIDSIKRVEILSVLQERLPEAPVVKPEHIGTLRTLGDVAAFIAQPEAATTGASHPAPVRPVLRAPTAEPVSAMEKPIRRYILTPRKLDESTPRASVVLPADSEVWITAEDTGLDVNLAGRLESLGYRPKIVTWTDVRRLSKPGLLGALIVLAPVRSVPKEFLHDAFRLLQFTGPGLRQAGKQRGSAFLTVSRLDGAFGLIGLSA